MFHAKIYVNVLKNIKGFMLEKKKMNGFRKCFMPKQKIFRRLIHVNPIALRKAKFVYYFGVSECSRVKKEK